jgi:hypothetical protein
MCQGALFKVLIDKMLYEGRAKIQLKQTKKPTKVSGLNKQTNLRS